MSRVSTPYSTKPQFFFVRQTFVTLVQVNWFMKHGGLDANDGRMKLIDVVLHERERLQQTIRQVVLFLVLVEKFGKGCVLNEHVRHCDTVLFSNRVVLGSFGGFSDRPKLVFRTEGGYIRDPLHEKIDAQHVFNDAHFRVSGRLFFDNHGVERCVPKHTLIKKLNLLGQIRRNLTHVPSQYLMILSVEYAVGEMLDTHVKRKNVMDGHDAKRLVCICGMMRLF